MTFDEYQKAAIRTLNNTLTHEQRITMLCMGLAGEAGETVDALKKVLFHGHTLDTDKVGDELGDLLWYITGLAQTLGLSLEKIAEKNAEKLRKRYPNGFSPERSVNRE
jgi:NTP pyrophosphatase (non-canonical NTP hydrolase)